MNYNENNNEAIILSGIKIGGNNELNAIRYLYEHHKKLLLDITTDLDTIHTIVEIFVLGVKDGIFSYTGTISVANQLLQIAEFLKDPDSNLVNETIRAAFENKILWEYYTTLFQSLSPKEKEILMKNYIDKVPMDELASHQVAIGQAKNHAEVYEIKAQALQKLYTLI